MANRISEVMSKKVWKVPLLVLLIITLGGSVVAFVSIQALLKSGAQDLMFEVSTDKKTYELNETIGIKLELINPTHSRICLNFNSAYQFDYRILDQAGNNLYTWSETRDFVQMLTSIHVNPHSSYEKAFNHLSQDFSLQQGVYTIKGIVVNYFLKDTTIEVLPNS
jgi:hypothetical protein